MMGTKPFLISLLLLSFSAHADRYMAYFGGSGDPAGATTIFDPKISILANYANSQNYNVDVAFDGGHATTENLLRSNFNRSPVKDFTPQSYEEIIARYERDIASGAIKAGDQIMVVMDTHGSQRYGGNLTHTVAAGRGEAVDLNQLKGAQTVSMDRLMNLSKFAQAKNIKLAVIDFSCHSGASLPLANSNTCVVTASGPETLAWASSSPTVFSTAFPTAMAPGKNLEDIFISTRAATKDSGFPMISTPAGISVQDRLYPLIEQYLNSESPKSDKFSSDVTKSVRDGICEQENADYNRLVALTREMESITAGLDLNNLRNALAAYHEYRQSIQSQLNAMGVQFLNQRREICGAPGMKQCNSMLVDLMVVVDVDARIADYQKQLANSKTAEDRARNTQWVAYFRNWKTAKDQFLREHPGIDKYDGFVKNYPDVAKRTEQMASKVAVEARKAYSALYQRSAASNPCRDFVL